MGFFDFFKQPDINQGIKDYQKTDDAVLLDYLSTLTGKAYSGAYDHVAKNLASGEKYYFLAVAIDRNGIMGAPQRLELSTKAVVPSSATISVSSNPSSVYP